MSPDSWIARRRRDRLAVIVELYKQGWEPGRISGRIGVGEPTVRKCLAAAMALVPSPLGRPRRGSKGK